MGGMSYWVRRYRNADEKEQKRIQVVLRERFNILSSDIVNININMKSKDYCIECGKLCHGTHCRKCFEHGKPAMISQLSRYHQKKRQRERIRCQE